MKHTPNRLFAFVALMCSTFLCVTAIYAQEARPNDALICHDEPIKLDRYRYLRSMSLDILGQPPTVGQIEELNDLTDTEPLPDAILTAMLNDPKFTEQVVRRHRSYFWPNLSNVEILRREQRLSSSRGIWWNSVRSQRYRTGTRDRVRCADRPASVSADGSIAHTVDENGFKIEGWVEVEPYWAPGEVLKVCAFDAQSRRYASDGTDCMAANSHRNVECGCGPNLRWCGSNAVQSAIRQGFTQSLEQHVVRIIDKGLSYIDLFTSSVDYVNGPIIHFYKYLAPNSSARFTPLSLSVNRLPAIDYTDFQLHEIVTSNDHAGVLTHPAYLLRFQTDRARATRFHEAFLCSPFMPPEGGLPVASEESARNPDLQERAGCKYCHSQLEPAAAHWGRWQENGAGFLHEDRFPAVDQRCYDCAMGRGGCTPFCRTYYLTQTTSEQEEPYLGKLKAYTFRRDRHVHHIAQGPKLIARKAAAENHLPVCVARKTAEWLLNRELKSASDELWLKELAQTFVRSDFRYRALVKAILLSPQYRRVR